MNLITNEVKSDGLTRKFGRIGEGLFDMPTDPVSLVLTLVALAVAAVVLLLRALRLLPPGRG